MQSTPMTLLRVPEVARILGCSTRTVKRRIADGSLPAVDVGVGLGAARLRVPEDALAEWIESRRVARCN